MKWLSRGAIFSYIHFLFIGSLSFEALSLQVTMQLPVNWLGCSEDIEGKNLSSWPAVFSNSNFYEVRGFLEWTILIPTQALTMPVPPISHIWSPAGMITGYPIKTIWVNPGSFWLFQLNTGWSFWTQLHIWGDPTAAFQYLQRTYRRDEERLFTRAWSDWIRENGLKLTQV